MSFPGEKYGGAGLFAAEYFTAIAAAGRSIDSGCLDAAAAMLSALIKRDGTLFVCGNGGSAALSNHFLCDFSKGIRGGTDARPRVVSLSNSIEIITAIANDVSYTDVFSYQLESLARPGDVVMTVSSSGDSENIVKALAWARDYGLQTLALTGFAGGRSATIADVNIHVRADNYGIVEDCHQSILHILAQYLRMERLSQETVAVSTF